MIELAALLHDLKDWKYSGSETAGTDCARAFLTERSCAPELMQRVCYVITHLGFKTELGQHGPITITPELAIVQDADRLDAIGAIGMCALSPLTFVYLSRILCEYCLPSAVCVYMCQASLVVSHSAGPSSGHCTTRDCKLCRYLIRASAKKSTCGLVEQLPPSIISMKNYSY